jgi:hypothetical protein
VERSGKKETENKGKAGLKHRGRKTVGEEIRVGAAIQRLRSLGSFPTGSFPKLTMPTPHTGVTICTQNHTHRNPLPKFTLST